MRIIVEVSETEVSESSDENEEDGAEQAAAEAVSAGPDNSATPAQLHPQRITNPQRDTPLK